MERYIYHDCKPRGSLERVDYSFVAEDGQRLEKYANVYLPANYDPAKPYNIFYLMHGGGGNPDAWFDATFLKNMLDYSIAEKRIEPMIVVTPSYRRSENSPHIPGSDGPETLAFQEELVEALIPAVEGKYNTYAENTTKDGIKASRMHRGFGGFSMGGSTTWFAFTRNLDYIAWFVPLSGDCWELGALAGGKYPKETAEIIKNAILKSGYSVNEYFLFPATGSEDIAYPNLTPQVEAMRAYPELFVETDDNPDGNFHYTVVEGDVHWYGCVCSDLYEILPRLFRTK